MKKVLFVCVENSCRSQMAEGFSKSLGKDVFEAFSAGSRPSGKVNEMAIEVMKETGIDLASAVSKGFSELASKEFDPSTTLRIDYVITMGCKDVCPFVPAKEHIDWQIEDPKGKGKDFFIKVRDDIRDRVKNLIRILKEVRDMAVQSVGEKYKCNVCGNEVSVTKVGGGELVCCNQPMEKL